MSTVIDGLAEADRMRALYGQHRDTRTAAEIITETGTATHALNATVQAWQTDPPHGSAIEAARVTVAGLSRLLAELSAKGADHDPA